MNKSVIISLPLINFSKMKKMKRLSSRISISKQPISISLAILFYPSGLLFLLWSFTSAQCLTRAGRIGSWRIPSAHICFRSWPFTPLSASSRTPPLSSSMGAMISPCWRILLLSWIILKMLGPIPSSRSGRSIGINFLPLSKLLLIARNFLTLKGVTRLSRRSRSCSQEDKSPIMSKLLNIVLNPSSNNETCWYCYIFKNLKMIWIL